MSIKRFLVMGISAAALVGCGNAQDSETAASEEAILASEASAPATNEASEPMVGAATLADAIAGTWRDEARSARDAFRNPQETLEFFQVDPSGTVVEIWPGGGWYTDIIAPWMAGNGGTYIAAHFPDGGASEFRQRSRDGYIERYSDTQRYGEIVMSGFDGTSGPLAEAGSVDTILSFRNVHNWMSGEFAEKAFADFYAALRPGGMLGIVEHRLPSTREQDPMGRSGYVQESYVIDLAAEAGFELVERSEINANPADTADHPFGVWTLPPVRRSAGRGEEPAADFDREAYDAIGESDRMTLLFRKPTDAE